MKKAFLLFNPNSGRVRAQGITLESLVERLASFGVEVVNLEVGTTDGVVPAIASIPRSSLIITAGGDGTVYEAVQSPACRKMRVGILPLGTANNLAGAVGIPLDLDEAIRVAVQGDEKRIDLGRVGKRIFTQAAGAGFHARAFHLYGSREDKSVIDGIRSFLNTMDTWRLQRMVLRIDRMRVEENVMQVTVANTPVYGRQIWIAPDAKIDDGLLDVAVITGCASKTELMSCIVKVMEGKGIDPSNVLRVRAKRVEILPSDDTDIPVHADAEPAGFAPAVIEVLPACLRLMVPG